eukprot:m.115522 g.115522  ORF g.115522 m.115522 type:complete len:567 (+) comp12842_c1_seq6:132-1832(+)
MGSKGRVGGSMPKFPILILIPIQSGSQNDFTRNIILSDKLKVGRAVQSKFVPAPDNAIFDSKVLSRSHAEIWETDGKVFIRDTKSSNGTWLNDQRLCESGNESDPFELKDGDRLRLGVDIRDERTVSHSCVIVDVGIQYPTRQSEPEVRKLKLTRVDKLADASKESILKELETLQDEYIQLHDDFEDLAQSVHDANVTEAEIEVSLGKLSALTNDNIRRMMEVGHEREHVDKLLTRIEALEMQLDFYKRANIEGDTPMQQQKIDEINDKFRHDHTARIAIKRAISEKTNALKELQSLKTELNGVQAAHKVDAAKAADDIRVQGLAMQELEEMKENAQTTIKELEEEMERRSRAHAVELKTKMDEMKDIHEKEQNQLSDTVNTLEAKVKQMKEEKQNALETVKEKEKETKTVADKNAVLESRVVALEDSVKANAKENKELLEKLSNTKQSLQKSKEAVENATNKMDSSITSLKKEQEKGQSLQKTLDSLQHTLSSRDKELKDVRRELDEEKEKRKRLVSETANSNSKLSSISSIKHFILGLCVSGAFVVLVAALQPTLLQHITDTFQ